MINKVILLGNLSTDPELKTSQGGTAYCKFNLATNKVGKDGKKIASFHRITCFGKLADIVGKYCSKGKQIYLEGELNYSSSENPDGTKKYFTDIIAFEIKFLSSNKEEAVADQQAPKQQEAFTQYTADDIPF